MFRKKWVLLCMLVLLVGCSNVTGKKALSAHIDQLEEALNKQDWEPLQDQATELKDLYDKNKWKIQLIGDEGEYEQLDESIDKFIAAIEMRKQTEAKLELATIRSLVQAIYSL
ncbi:DUF4363 family protein [Virgibacillus soli]|uniref:DUF4363 family protein n=1 Tax=Paracerasibacillus soli TaxID=480284 RepID=UPI0035EAA06C